MSTIRRLRMALISAVLGTLMVIAAPAVHAQNSPPPDKPGSPNGTAVAWDDQTGQQLQAWACSPGWVCFWNGFNGTGRRCAWDIDDPDWWRGTYDCSWADDMPVKSVYARGNVPTYTGVAYYPRDNFDGGRIGCTRDGTRGNLSGTYKVRSHRWVTNRCG